LRNAPEVKVDPKGGIPLEYFGYSRPKGKCDGGPCPTRAAVRRWVWRPVAGDELDVQEMCDVTGPSDRACNLEITRSASLVDAESAAVSLLPARVEGQAFEMAQLGDARHIRTRGNGPRGAYTREITYAYGAIELGPARR
jgi:hypothetical protein